MRKRYLRFYVLEDEPGEVDERAEYVAILMILLSIGSFFLLIVFFG